jgi:AcrR family transcriptional regulator
MVPVMTECAPSPEPEQQDASPFQTAAQRDRGRAQHRFPLFRAAVRMFNARGFHATSLDDVAASLGISKPTIYYYLGNKEDVLVECVTRGIEMLQAAAVLAGNSDGSGLGRLRIFLRHYAEIAMGDFGIMAIRTSEEALSEQGARHFRALKAEIDTSLRRLVADGIADGSIAPLDIKLAAFTLAGALNWTARWHNPEGLLSPDQIAGPMVDMLTTGLQPRDAGRTDAI